MPIVFAAVTPHPPLLISTIGKEKSDIIAATKVAMSKLEEELYVAKPHVIVIISPHASLFAESFSINAHTHMITNFAQFGDLVTIKEWKGTPELAAKISHLAKERHLPVQLVSQEQLDHGATVPLYTLTSHMADVRILPVGYSHLPAEKHKEFGALLKDGLMESGKRIAIIASGDLTHSDHPIPSTEKTAHPFDQKIMDGLVKKDVSGIFGLEQDSEAAKECGYRSILVALGMIEHMDFSFETYAYEAPFGVGYLTGNFHV